jgi:hypothetical protein
MIMDALCGRHEAQDEGGLMMPTPHQKWEARKVPVSLGTMSWLRAYVEAMQGQQVLRAPRSAYERRTQERLRRAIEEVRAVLDANPAPEVQPEDMAVDDDEEVEG